MAKNPRLIDLIGARFGKWLVLEKAGNKSNGAAIWLCRCDCGNHGKPIGTDLRNGKSTNCGCEGMKRFHAATRTHGGTGTRLYRTWKSMHSRCNNPNATGYRRYGGAGIKVCGEWRDFVTFCAWAEQTGYADNLTIERKNNALGYGPSNCIWTTKARQAVNRHIVLISPTGEPWCDVARRHGIPITLMHGRTHDGWPIEKAATIPKGGTFR